ncbi:Zinc finger HIT domain-containing protein 2, partial [Durusdinium trenchii]
PGCHCTGKSLFLRFLQEEETEETEDSFSEDRLQMLADLASRGALRVEDLSEEEARSFFAELKKGDLARAIGPWEPWWHQTAVVDLMSMDDECTNGDERLHRSPPEHLCCSATGDRKAHPSVVFTLLEALYAYVHTMRSFNGDWDWDPLQAAAHMFHIGRSIWGRQVYSSATEALQASQSMASKLPGSFAPFDRHCLGDVATLLRRSLGSCARAILEAKELSEQAHKLAEEPKSASRLLRGVKKLEFLSAFAWYHEEVLSVEVAAEVQALQEILEGAEAKAAQRMEMAKNEILLPERN